MTNNGGFKGKVLEALDNIKSTQTRHEKLFDKLFDRLDTQVGLCDKRFDKINSKVDTAEGFAKGAMVVGGLGAGGGILSFIMRIFK